MLLDRLERARRSMEGAGVDALLISVGSDLAYLTGYQAMASERLTMLVMPAAGQPTLLVPELEAPRVGGGPFRLRVWKETEDPLNLVAFLVEGSVVAVSDQLWAGFLLGLQERLPSRRFISAAPITRELRIRKEPAEIKFLRAAARAADRVVEELRRTRFSERQERDLSREVARLTVDAGHDEASFAIVASGANGASPHHEPGERLMVPGDLVVVDFGGKVGGYGSDCTRTFAVGVPGPEQKEVHAFVRAAQHAALTAVRPGVPAEVIDQAARSVIIEAGYGDYFIHRTGHGIGLDGHEHPYLVAGNGEEVKPGMCFSIEPGIYLPGRFGVRIEDIVTVTDQGVESLNQADRSLIEVE